MQYTPFSRRRRILSLAIAARKEWIDAEVRGYLMEVNVSCKVVNIQKMRGYLMEVNVSCKVVNIQKVS
jgi:hypothetical protein